MVLKKDQISENFSAQNANVTDQSNSSATEQMEIDTVSNENENSDIDSNSGNTETLNKTKNFSGVPGKDKYFSSNSGFIPSWPYDSAHKIIFEKYFC